MGLRLVLGFICAYASMRHDIRLYMHIDGNGHANQVVTPNFVEYTLP